MKYNAGAAMIFNILLVSMSVAADASQLEPGFERLDTGRDLSGWYAAKWNEHVIESAWPIGESAERGLGLQKEIGTFDFRDIRIKEKNKQRTALDVEKQPFGTNTNGETIDLYTLTNCHGMTVRVMTFGATLIGVDVPDRNGQFANVTLDLDTCANYVRGHPLFGSIVGRYANRIAGAKFTLDGVEYQLTPNAGGNHIHGGRKGFQRSLWKATAEHRADNVCVKLQLVSPDGDAGYPGTLAVSVTYTLNNQNELTLEYTATTDKPTHINLTNHAYWNLAGAGAGDVLSHLLMLNADDFLQADHRKIPTGEIRSVAGTPMDFTTPHTIGSRVEDVPGGYDHCYVLNKTPDTRLSLAARVTDPKSGRVMEVLTTQPGVQLYTANGLSNRYQARGKPYGPHQAVCLETQHYPDSPNKPQFPSTVLRPGETYHEVTVYRFRVEE